MYLIKLFCKHEIIYRSTSKDIIDNCKPVIITCWHSRFMILFSQNLKNFYAVTSAHDDGNYLQKILEYYGHKAIRGSSRRQGTNAIREILKIKPSDMRLVITPDGPIGPKFKVKGNVINIAKKFEVPIIVATYSATHALVLKTWDRFIIPIPFVSKILIIIDKPFESNTNINQADLESSMLEITKQADKSCKIDIDY